jgi:hypothetical protein
MRIRDIDPKYLCRNHLLGEHNELHAIWSIITQGRKGYSHHPETRRWKGRLRALYDVHQKIVQEMESRGYRHHSPLDKKLAKGIKVQDVFVDSVERQMAILGKKGCSCILSQPRSRVGRDGKSREVGR